MQSINQKTKEHYKETIPKTDLEKEKIEEEEAERNEEFSPSKANKQGEKFHFQPSQNQPNDEELEAQKKADDLRIETAEHKKIEQLLIITQEKGADFAIKVAQKAKDPCLLDLFHDTLIQKGIKKAN
ncbi:hypothetical protein L6252_01265 [Candidatus Parcubacteria bacterium]|nr:hypothetical protein [Candidatus Parcubacteria bacterium]